MTLAERRDLNLRVYFANTDPTLHPLYNSSLVDLVDRSGSAQDGASPAQIEELVQLERNRDLRRKIALDFSYALYYAYNSSSSPYIAIFEGDIMFADGWFARSRRALDDIDGRTNSTRESWLDMRLFNEERSIGWASSDMFGNNVPLIIILISVGTLLILSTIRCYSTFGRKVVTNTFLVVVCGISIPLFIVLFFQAGKSSILPPSPGVKKQQWGCCTQGMIMPREQIPSIANELLRRAGTAPDIIIEDYARDRKLLRFALDPVQIQHLGE
jgi:hypothetical protein